MISSIVSSIYWVLQIFIWGLIIHIFLGYFLGPDHPIRQFLARIYEPMLAVIRQYMPQTGMMDFSPLVLVFLVYLIQILLGVLF